LIERPAPRDPFNNGSGAWSTISKNPVRWEATQ
jgi:hypothetical protein